MDRELLEKIVKTYMFVETIKERKSGKITHILVRDTKQELSVATGKPIFTDRDWNCGEYNELIPGIDDINLVGHNTRFADKIAYYFREYNKLER